MEKKRLHYARFMAGFLVLMAIFTFLSRALDSLTVPKVTIAYSKVGNVKYEINGEGTFQAETGGYVSVESGLKINRIYRKAGQSVVPGDAIFSYQMEGILDKQEELRLQIQKASLELKQMEVEARHVPTLSDSTLALQALDSANRAFETGNQELEETKVLSNEKQAEIKKKYNTNIELTEEEMEAETRRIYKSAELAYDAAVTKRNSTIKRAERTLAEAQKKLDKLLENQASEADVDAARESVSSAEEHLDEVREEQDFLVEEAEDTYDNAQDDYSDVDSGNRSAAEALKNNYQSAIEAEEDKIKAAEKHVESLREAIRQAELAVENAKVTDAGAATVRQKAAESAALQKQVKELDYQELTKKLAHIEKLVADGGEIKALTSGVIVELGVTPGAACTGSEVIRLGDEALKFEGVVEKRMGEIIKPGNHFMLQYGDEGEKSQATIDYVDYVSNEDSAKITATIEDGVGRLGASAGFTISLESEQYNQVIPIEVLRQDSVGYYVLLVGTKKTVLGEELEAIKLNVDVLEKSSTQAAISGAFAREDRLIMSSSKTVYEGDRIRISE